GRRDDGGGCGSVHRGAVARVPRRGRPRVGGAGRERQSRDSRQPDATALRAASHFSRFFSNQSEATSMGTHTEIWVDGESHTVTSTGSSGTTSSHAPRSPAGHWTPL